MLTTKLQPFQLSKSDGILSFQLGSQPLATMVHWAFDIRNRFQIALIECDIVNYGWTQQVIGPPSVLSV